MTRPALLLAALVLTGCNLIFGLDEAETRPEASAAGGGGGTSATSTSSGVTSSTTTSTTTSGEGGASTTSTGSTGAGGDGGDGGANTSSVTTSGGGEGGGGGGDCPVVHELVEDFTDYDLGSDPTWEELSGDYSLVTPVDEDGYALRFELTSTSKILTRASVPAWTLVEGDLIELSARSRGLLAPVTDTWLSIGTPEASGTTHALALSTAGTLTASEAVIPAEFALDDARVWIEAASTEEGLFDVDDVVVRIRRCN